MSQRLPQAAGKTALLIIDMINDMDFGKGDDLLAQIDTVAPVIARLRDEAEAAGIPVVFVNDNFGQWHSNASRIVDYVEGTGGSEILTRLRPKADDYFVIKPQVSGFYATNLPVLLPRLGVSRLILTGVAADICVLFTAADAHMREYGLWVPGDGVASDRVEHRDWALGIMAKSMSAETRPTTDYSIGEWLAAADGTPSSTGN